ncbi:capsule biosynthesis protein [Novacetimonas pomaceti]|nr:capsule biosynthesis protein [Novacetimonas pomaceti]
MINADTHSGIAAFLRRHAPVLIVVVLPTFLALVYYTLIASGQYESEAAFVVKDSRPAPRSSSSSTSMMGATTGMAMAAGSGGAGLAENFAVNTYLKSHDAVDSLQQRLNLVAMYRHPDIDILSRLFYAHPTPERLLWYYLNHIDVVFHEDTGVTTLDVRAFRPEDAKRIADELLKLGEERINEFNRLVSENTIKAADEEVAIAEKRVKDVQHRMTAFRQRSGDIDPTKSSVVGISLIGQLETELAQSDTQLAQMLRNLNASSPQVLTIKQRIKALNEEIEAQRRLTQKTKGVYANIADYDELMLDREFAQEAYMTSASELETARSAARQQQVYVVRVVEPNLPGMATYPRIFLMTLAVFVGSGLTFMIGRLLITGMREHAI